MSSSPSYSNQNIGVVALVAAASIAAHAWIVYKAQQAPTKKQQQQQQPRQQGTTNNDSSSLASIVHHESQLKPPFPQAVRDMLSKCRLAYLSTVDATISSSHLSLMRFTYLCDPDDGEVVIMTTQRRTKKFDMLQQQNGVALLVHDFRQDGDDGVYSITLNGICRTVTDVKKAEHYRAQHLEHNPDYPQFIVGEDIAILCVDVTSARICDINDHVRKWNVGDNVESSTTSSS
jgi:hypothetical protein